MNCNTQKNRFPQFLFIFNSHKDTQKICRFQTSEAEKAQNRRFFYKFTKKTNNIFEFTYNLIIK